MLGHQAVDPITGDLSTIIGVRMLPDTNVIIPVTQASGGHKKRKPPLGAVAMLEDEVVARRGFWRRQRQREEQLTENEFTLSQTLLNDVESITVKKVENALASMMEKSHEIDDAAKLEVKRRNDSEQELSTVLPPEVLAVLTEGDQSEREHEEGHYAAHKKYVDTVRKFVSKLEMEERKYKGRMEELENAMNPDAEAVVEQRYNQAKTRLQGELRDQIQSRMENLDEKHAALEYTRERNELLTVEAKVVLMNSAVLAGDYDVVLSGIYGAYHLMNSSADNELVPMLKQLIAMLESGGPFLLSSDLLTIINQDGDQNIRRAASNMAEQGQLKVSTVKTGDQSRGLEQEQLVQNSTTGGAIRTAGRVVANTKDLFGTIGNGEQSKKNQEKSLFEKQTFEAAKLENELRSSEIDKINATIEEFEQKKEFIVKDLQAELKKKLRDAKNEEEREAIMLTYAQDMQKLTDGIERQKQAQLEELRKRLLERRRQAKKEMHRNHIGEAKSMNLKPDVVPDMAIPTHSELDKDLLLLAQQQEKLLADMLKAAAEESVDDGRDIDAEMEARIRHLNSRLGGREVEAVKLMKDSGSQTDRRTQDMKKKLRARKDRHRKQKDLKDLENLSSQEKEEIMATGEVQSEADRLREENALIAVLKSLEEVRVGMMN